MIKHLLHAVALFALVSPSGFALAAGSHGDGHGHAEEGGHHANKTGTPGDPTQADRTIELKLNEMAFSESAIHVEKGETIRFVLINEGDLVHEFNIGTAEMHVAHAEEMEAMIESGMLEADRINMDMAGAMAHDDPNSVLLAPGESGEVVWTFSEDVALEFSCNVPGHREGGMMGQFDIGGGHQHSEKDS